MLGGIEAVARGDSVCIKMRIFNRGARSRHLASVQAGIAQRGRVLRCVGGCCGLFGPAANVHAKLECQWSRGEAPSWPVHDEGADEFDVVGPVGHDVCSAKAVQEHPHCRLRGAPGRRVVGAMPNTGMTCSATHGTGLSQGNAKQTDALASSPRAMEITVPPKPLNPVSSRSVAAGLSARR